MKKWLLMAMLATATAALMGCSAGGKGCEGSTTCGGSGTGTTTPVTTPSVTLALSSATVTSAQPATVTAKVLDGSNKPVTGVVVSFSTNAAIGATNPSTALTDANGLATTTLSPASTSAVGADAITASASVGGTAYTASSGYQINATSAAITDFTAETGTAALAAYGQTLLDLTMTGVSTTVPATVNVTSTCLTLGKATISPTTVSVNSGATQFTYKDTGGCGSTISADTVTVSVSGSSVSKSAQVTLTSPTANSISFTSATPPQIYLKGSGNRESSTVLFKVVDTAGNGLPGQKVTLTLSSYAGGLLLDQKDQADLTSSDVTKHDVQTSDSSGNITAIVNSGTVPTPVRVIATLDSGASTVSSSLAVVTGLPTQLHFSMSQATVNIEGGWGLQSPTGVHDGVANTYTIIASDRSGNPVPDGTSIVMWAEGGQVQGAPTTTTVNNTSSATAQFVTSDPRPADGRVTVLAYAIGEESFVDTTGTNIYTPSPATNPTNYQDLGDVVKSRLFNGVYDPVNDEVVSLSGSGAAASTSACVDNSASYPQFALDSTIPTKPNTCDAQWSSRTYVRRAVETVFSSSTPRPVWAIATGHGNGTLDSSCSQLDIYTSPSAYTDPSLKSHYIALKVGDTYYTSGVSAGTFNIILADDNPTRLNPMPAGTIVSAGSLTANLGVAIVGGSPVPSQSTASVAQMSYTFTAPLTSGTATLTFKTPLGIVTTLSFNISTATPPTACAL